MRAYYLCCNILQFLFSLPLAVFPSFFAVFSLSQYIWFSIFSVTWWNFLWQYQVWNFILNYYNTFYMSTWTIILNPYLKLIFTPEFFFRYTKFRTRIAWWCTYFFCNDMAPFYSFIDWTLEFFCMAIFYTISTFWSNFVFYLIAGTRSNSWKIATIML